MHNLKRCLPIFLNLLASSVFAAGQPDAGHLLESLRPAPIPPSRDTGVLPETPVRPAMKIDDSIKIAIKDFRLSGNQAIGEAELRPLLDEAVGREVTLGELQEVIERITQHYRSKGYLLARAYLPAQDIRDGMVEVAVLEGRLAKLNIDNTSSLDDARVHARLAGLAEGRSIDGTVLERNLLLLNDLPGVEVKSTLKPGASVGTTDLDIRLAGRPPFSGNVELDNYGNRYTGDIRLSAGLAWANPLGIGDVVSLRAVKSSGMDYGRLAWQLPVGAAGTQVGAAWSDMRYKLGKDFAALDAHGSAQIANVYVLHPFVRSRLVNVNGQLAYDHKTLDERIDSTATASDKTLDVWTLGLSGSRMDGLGGGGFSSWSVSYTAGWLDLDAASLALDKAGHRTQGAYGKGNFSLARIQSLSGELSLYASLQAQLAGNNLDSSEKMSLGGPQAVRAYPQGEASTDDAWLANLELRYRLAADWQASLFYDAARGRQNHNPLATDSNNWRRLSGAGLGLSYERPGDLSLQIGLAWRDGPSPTSDTDRSPRGWVQAVKRF